jgi:hypothetical protein
MFFFTDLDSFPVTTVDSSQVFHAPQAGHFPNHFGDSLPHSLQKKTVFSFAIVFALMTSQGTQHHPYCGLDPQSPKRGDESLVLGRWRMFLRHEGNSVRVVTLGPVSVYAAKIRKTPRKRIESKIFPIFVPNS